MLEYGIGDIGTNDEGDGFGSAFFSVDGGLNHIIAIVDLDFGFIPHVDACLLR